MVFNPMGDRLLTVTSEGNAILWDACSGSLLFNPSRHEARIKDASFCPDGVCFLTVAADTKVKIWNPEIPSRPLRVLEHEVEVDHACFYNNGKEVVTVDTYGTTRIWDLDSTEFKILEPKLRGKVALLRAITRRDFVCAGTLNDAVWSYNVPLFSKSTKNHQFYRGSGISSDGPVVSIDVASDGASCVAAFQDQTVHIARVGGYSSWNQPILLAGSVTKVIYGVRSGTVWTVTKDGTITRWSWQRLYLQLRRHPVHSSSVSIPGMVKGAVFSPAGDRVLAWLKDRTAKVFNAMDGTLLATTAVHDAELQEATFDPTGSRVATISQDGVWLWDATTGERLIGPLTHPSGKPIAAIAFSQDGAQLATGGLDHDAIVWDSEFGRQIAGPLRHGGQVMELAFDKSGLNLACAAGDGYVHLWTLGGFPRDKFPCKMGECPELIIDPGWKRLLGDGLDSTIRVYSLERDVKSVASIPHRSSAVRASFSPDGTQVITSISDRSIQTWSVENGRPITPPIKHDKNIKSATFDASGERILTTCEGGTLQVWDAVTGWPLLDRFNLDRSEIRAQFDPKGRRILVLSETGCHVLDLGLGLPPPPSWFLDLAEAIVCRKLDDQALPVPLDGSPTRIRDIRSTLLSLGQEDDGYLSIARHLLAMD
jgi:WD40 repeat protein